ncbi:MAG: hypothetical protein EAX81_05980 [Candidatus Thorarchaeota archaeon]|nr:hypothetical protein [Candidatus Thorarchaeota archaeon]
MQFFFPRYYAQKSSIIETQKHSTSLVVMKLEHNGEEHPAGYYVCVLASLLPICFLILYPLTYTGLEALPWALLMLAVVILPILSCGLDFRGRPLFQFHYHGIPFKDEIMDLADDE